MCELIVKDPLGGVKGDDLKTTNPFSVDRKRALSDINSSIDWIEGRKGKVIKLFCKECVMELGEKKKKFQTGSPQQIVNLMALTLH